MQLCQWAGMRLLGLNDHEGYGRKRRSFGAINEIVIFQEKMFLKRDFLPFQQTSTLGKMF